MDEAAVLDWVMRAGAWLSLAFLAYGAYLVLGGGGFRRDAPEDAARPHLDLFHFG